MLLGHAACSSGERDPGGEVLAEIGDHRITLEDVDARIQELPSPARTEHAGNPGRLRMRERMIEEELLHRAAREEGVPEDEEVARAITEFTRRTVVQAYLDRTRERARQVDEEEARVFYESHRDEYRTERMLRVRIVLSSTEVNARVAHGVISGRKASFIEAVGRYSDDPLVLQGAGLIPTWVRKGRAVPWIGNQPAFHEAVFALSEGEVSEPIETSRGWVVAGVEEVREPRQRPFEEVRNDVVARIAETRTATTLPDLLASLRERYRVRVYDLPGVGTAEELYAQAQQAPSPRRQVELYEELVSMYPDAQQVPDAAFMIGFLRSEQLGDSAGARQWFTKVVELAPDSDLARSARWMLSSGGEDPPFEAGPTPEGQGGDAP